MSSPSQPLLSVAQIALLASDVLVDSQPQLPATSQFLQVYNAQRNSTNTVHSLPPSADAGPVLLRQRNVKLISYTTISNARVFNRLLVHLPELSKLPLVLHIVANKDNSDLSDVLVLRSNVPFFIYSRTAQQAYDNALLASRLAMVEKKAVVHVFHSVNTGARDSVENVEEDAIRRLLLAEKEKSLTPNGYINGNANGHANGHSTNDDLKLDAASKLFAAYQAAASDVIKLTGRPLLPLIQHGSSKPHTLIFTLGHSILDFQVEGVLFVDVSLLTPFPHSQIPEFVSPSVLRIIVLEEVRNWLMKWTPLYLDIVSAVQSLNVSRPTTHSGVLGDTAMLGATDIIKLVDRATSSSPKARLELGSPITSKSSREPTAPHVPKHEASHTTILNQLFGERLEISNSPTLVPSQGQSATSPEFALGRVRGQIERRADLVRIIQELLKDTKITADLHSLLSQWTVVKDDPVKSREAGKDIIDHLESSTFSHPAIQQVSNLRSHFAFPSRWIIGSDAWSYDLGSSGLHHAIASGLNINILILDTIPYSSRNKVDPERRKRDVGLYAMNHGDVYVASIAVYSSYSHVLQALIEADKFTGPSVILAYLPYDTEETSALQILKETKLAVDAGYWPLYRWNPAKEREGKEPFTLDSDSVKNDLQQFLDRQNHLSQLTRSKPQFATELVSSLGETVKEARKKRAQNVYDELLSAIDAPPLLVVYSSDGGQAEKVAKRLANRGKLRGLSTSVSTLNSISLADLGKEEYVVFVTSVAGQGEFPQNGRTGWKLLSAAAGRGEKSLVNVKFTVFGMGDSHYWPRPEDAHYYNKTGKDLNKCLEQLGADRIVELGLGDSQDADGYETGYRVWEPTVWKALGVAGIEVKEVEPDPITNEHIKAASSYLRGTIAEGLQDTTSSHFAASDTQVTKFHGIYQQDDRDIRDERQAQGVEPAYVFMIRLRMPGGVCDSRQWLLIDRIADEHGCGTLKITNRQTLQFHGIIKQHLKPAIQDINRALLDTIAACGDVNRNVLCSSIPTRSRLYAQVDQFARKISDNLIPRTTAYHEIWLDKKMVAGDALKDVEPLYGKVYLPRKFKIAVAVPPNNDVDIFSSDVGFIAIVDDDGNLSGFNLTAGGGMGITHGNRKTYPRLADVLGFCTPEQGQNVAEKIMLIQRDNGNRQDRKLARLKYTIENMGLDNFKAELERRLGFKLQPARPYSFNINVDEFGWVTGEDGKHHCTIFIENGRIQDEPGRNFKTGLREVAKVHKGEFRLTANQHVVIANVASEDLPAMKRVLVDYKLDNLSLSGLRLSSSACVALPTCGLALAEAERYLPILVDKVEKICEENGLRNDSIVMRMTGCANGCTRPYLGEIAFVGKAPGSYVMLLGGGYYGQRLNKIYRETVSEPEILAILKPMIKQYALERMEGEHFGDWVIRAGYIAPATSGPAWYDRIGGEGEHREVAI